jgi:predicted dehydrogenase
MPEPIRLAIIGAGLFARDAHIPAILALGDSFKIVAIYSRTRANAAARAAEIPYPVDITDDLPGLLARTDLEAVDVVLPIDIMSPVIEMALASGKHVISEKPIAPDVATGRKLIAGHTGRNLWMVAENWRYEEMFVKAGELIAQGEIGRPMMASWSIHSPINAKYLATEWRRSGSFPGGFLMDGGVHHAAAWRLALGEVERVSAFTALMHADFLPADTICANLQFANGVIGTYSVIYGSKVFWTSGLTVSGENGYLSAWRDAITVNANGETRTIKASGVMTVNAELEAFAAAVRSGTPHQGEPVEALRDVAVIEAMLRSAETGQSIAPERI